MIIILTDCHNSNSITLNEIVIHGSNHIENTMFGGNLHVMMFSTPQENKLKKPTTISIRSSTFSNGIGRCSPVFKCYSGGLTLSFTGESLLDVRILINGCTFMGNKAIGAVVSILFVARWFNREHSYLYQQINVFKEYSQSNWWWHCNTYKKYKFDHNIFVCLKFAKTQYFMLT